MLRSLVVVALVLLAACSRPLTPNETAFAHDLFGDELDTSKVRVALFPGIIPVKVPLADEATIIVGTERACVREPQPRGEFRPRAVAYRNLIQFDFDFYAHDMALLYPERVRFPKTFLLAHELTHVWQWQNRETTGYQPWRAALEQLQVTDPYFSASGEEEEFFRFGFEQQAAIVTDFVCFTASNPDHPRRQELRELLLPVLPVDRFERAIRGE